MSELRQDFISGDWVIVAPGRAARPKFLDAQRPQRKASPRTDCPFEENFLKKNNTWPPQFAFPNQNHWKLIVLPNKYPALTEAKVCSVPLREGIYSARTGVGEHDLIITRDHNKNFAELTAGDAASVFSVFQMLCNRAAQDACATYAVPFWNWGPLAGASVWHPHYQFLSLPVIPAHSARSIAGAAAYFKKHHRCAQCEVISFERKLSVGKEGGPHRVVAENKNAIAIASYAGKLPFEIRVMPKRHESYFYKTGSRTIGDTARLVQYVLKKLKAKVNDPDINVFIHEAPLDGKRHDYHHWHAEIIPRVTTPAGFELSTGIFINSMEPEKAAAILRGKKR